MAPSLRWARLALLLLQALACLRRAGSAACDNQSFPVSGWFQRPAAGVPFSHQYRVSYYLGKVRRAATVRLTAGKVLRYYTSLNATCMLADRLRLGDPPAKLYYKELLQYLQDLSDDTGESVGVLAAVGDIERGLGVPILTKARPVASSPDNQNVLLLFSAQRHLHKPLAKVQQYDVPHASKKPVLFWRGTATGHCSDARGRCALVRRWHDGEGMDIGFADLQPFKRRKGFAPWGPDIHKEVAAALSWGDTSKFEPLMRGKISMRSHLRHKYIVSVEGFDVATNLKWLLYANSTPFMPAPRVTSWFMEDHLVPWVHYVPVEESFCDLDEKLRFCLDFPARCEQIAANGRAFLQQFLDADVERKVRNMVLQRYAKLVRLEILEPAVLRCNNSVPLEGEQETILPKRS